jgi:Uncharacterized conserved domain (SAYSvFN)
MGITSVVMAILFELQPFRLKDCRTSLRWLNTSFGQIGSGVHELVSALLNLSRLFVKDATWRTYLFYLTWAAVLCICYRYGIERLWLLAVLFSAIFMNLRDKSDGELSAYSVFNRGMQRLMGTMTAEQFENEILHHQRRPGAEQHHEEEDDEQEDEGEGQRLQRHVRGKKARRTYEARLERRRLEQLEREM